MCNFYTALKEKKWRKAYLRCFFSAHKTCLRVSRKRLQRANKNFTFWHARNCHLFWDFDNPYVYYYDLHFKKKMSYYV